MEANIVPRRLDRIEHQLAEMHSDLLFIKAFFIQIAEKKDTQRKRKENEVRAKEREKKEVQRREIYEETVRHLMWWPWEVMPAPQSGLSEEELTVVYWLSRGKTDAEIATLIGAKGKIAPRFYDCNSKLKLKSREELITWYNKYRAMRREHSSKRAFALVRLLYSPPPGFFRRGNLEVSWQRKLGRGRGDFHYAGPQITDRYLNYLEPRDHEVLQLLVRGVAVQTIAERLATSESAVRARLNALRSNAKAVTGTTVDLELIVSWYRNYLKRLKKFRGESREFNKSRQYRWYRG